MIRRSQVRRARRRPGDRPEADIIRRYYTDHELHEVADALTRGGRELSSLSALAAKHGISLGLKRDCQCLCRIVKHVKAALRRFIGA